MDKTFKLDAGERRRQLCAGLVTFAVWVLFICPVRLEAKSSEVMACKARPKLSRAEKEKTVVDFLMEVPAELLHWNNPSGTPFTIQERFDRIRLCDEKNGYLEIDNSQLDGDWIPTIALFKRRNQPPLLGFGFQNSNLVFLEKGASGWADVSSKMMPSQITDAFINDTIRRKIPAASKLGSHHRFTDNASDPAVIYELPRKGRYIRALSGNGGPGIVGKELFKLQLGDKAFEIVP